MNTTQDCKDQKVFQGTWKKQLIASFYRVSLTLNHSSFHLFRFVWSVFVKHQETDVQIMKEKDFLILVGQSATPQHQHNYGTIILQIIGKLAGTCHVFKLNTLGKDQRNTFIISLISSLNKEIVCYQIACYSCLLSASITVKFKRTLNWRMQ